MALSRVKVWSAGEILYALDLNSEFNNILNNGLSLISPLTTSLNAGGFKLSNYGATDAPTSVTDAALNAFVQSGTSASTRTLQNKMREIVSLEDFGAVGDGVADDAAAIALAIAAVSANGEIRGSPGKTYLIGAAGISIASKTSVRIVGNGAKIKLNAVATQAPSGLGSTAIFLDTCTNTIFTGWEIDGNAKASNVVGAKACTDCEISFNKINSGGLNGVIFTNNNTRMRYLFNTISTTTGTARGMWLGNFNTSQMDADFLVIGNNVTGCPASGIVCCSVGGRVEGNHVSGTTAGSGIIFGGGNGFSSKYLAIVGNTCRSIGANGHGIQSDVIYSTSADVPIGIVIAGNVCELNEGTGIFAVYMNGSTIANNVCINNNAGGAGSGYGIFVDEAQDLAISGNYCCDTRAGASRTQTVGLSITADIATNNIKNIAMSGNVCNNNLSHGIQVTNVAAETVTGYSITGNHCSANGSRGIIITEATSATVTRGVITDNVCNGNTTTDLRVDVLDVALTGNQYTTEASVVYLTFTDLDTTPSVKGQRRKFRCNNSGATNLTTFDDSVPGQEWEVWFLTANTTLVQGATLTLVGSVNVTPTAGSSMRFWNRGGGVITEVGRDIF